DHNFSHNEFDTIVPIYDMIMSTRQQMENRLKLRRLQKNWSQADLAARAGISRAAVSAIEMNRLSPSVTAALALAKALDCSVAEVFGNPPEQNTPLWAWSPPSRPCRYWRATSGSRTILYPVEPTLSGMMPHDGIYHEGEFQAGDPTSAEKTIVMACCDPA